MKGITILLLVSIVVGTVFLCGCQQQNSANNVSGDTSKVILVDTDYVHRPTSYGYYDYYKGTVKNVAGHMLNKVVITVSFYDVNNNFLFSKTDTINNLANSYSKDFWVTVYSYDNYAEFIDHCKYNLKVYS